MPTISFLIHQPMAEFAAIVRGLPAALLERAGIPCGDFGRRGKFTEEDTASPNRALAALEYLVHVDRDLVPDDLVFFRGSFRGRRDRSGDTAG
jgi:hypothetical protein